MNAHRIRGTWLQRFGRFGRALGLVGLLASGAAAQQAEISPGLRQVYQQTRTARGAGDMDRIIAACRRAIEAEEAPGDAAYASQLLAWALNRRGELAWDAGNRGPAVRDFSAAIEADPTRWRAAQNLAIAAAGADNFERAERWMDRVLELNPDYANAHFNRGEIRLARERAESALADYERAIELTPGEADFHSGRAHALFRLGRTDEALAEYRRATELAPDEATHWVDRGDALQSAGRWAEAAAHYRRAIALPGGTRTARLRLAWLLTTCPDDAVRDGPAAAALLAGLASAREPSVREAETRAAVAAEQGRWNDATRWLQRAIDRSDDEDRTRALQARRALYEAGKPFRQPRTAAAEAAEAAGARAAAID